MNYSAQNCIRLGSLGSDQETRLAIRYARSVVVEFFVETTV